MEFKQQHVESELARATAWRAILLRLYEKYRHQANAALAKPDPVEYVRARINQIKIRKHLDSQSRVISSLKLQPQS
jgi:hypothetical protein